MASTETFSGNEEDSVSTTALVLYLPQAAELLNMPEARLYELTRSRASARMDHPIPFFRIGRRVAFTRAALEAWVMKLQNAGAR
jgi:predicted DNA-binding transcriptional regulator AlpA